MSIFLPTSLASLQTSQRTRECRLPQCSSFDRLTSCRAWRLKVLSIFSSIPKDTVSERLAAGQVTGCGSAVPQLEQETLDKTPRVVAQMGPEPFLQAMIANPDFDVVIGGRAYDPAPYVAFCAFHAKKYASDGTLSKTSSLDLGCWTHVGKILECGGICAVRRIEGTELVPEPLQLLVCRVYADNSYFHADTKEQRCCCHCL